MSLNLTDNYFQLFGMRPAFRIDARALEEKYHELQRVLHPDRYASAGQNERRIASQAAARVNDAYRVLGDDCERAAYLLELEGVRIDEQSNTRHDAEFLTRQMELREALDEGAASNDAEGALTALADRVAAGRSDTLDAFERAWRDGETGRAVEAMNQARFFHKMEREVKASLHRIRNAANP